MSVPRKGLLRALHLLLPNKGQKYRNYYCDDDLMHDGRNSSLISVLVKVVGNITSGLAFLSVIGGTGVDSGCIPSSVAVFVLYLLNGGLVVAL